MNYPSHISAFFIKMAEQESEKKVEHVIFFLDKSWFLWFLPMNGSNLLVVVESRSGHMIFDATSDPHLKKCWVCNVSLPELYSTGWWTTCTSENFTLLSWQYEQKIFTHKIGPQYIPRTISCYYCQRTEVYYISLSINAGFRCFRIRTTPHQDNSPPYRYWSWWVVLFRSCGPSRELSW